MRLPDVVRKDPLWAYLDDHWKPIPKRPGYAVGIGIMAALILLLPLLYMAIIAGIGFGVYWHIVNDVPNFDHVRPRTAIWLLILYLVPAVVGITLIAFLLKPLFAPRSREARQIRLEQFEELQLHNFVHNVCAVVGAPAPREIFIDCDVNASAHFRRGVLSMFLKDDVALTIGLPLVAGMTKRQFAGVLAHEFGHFAQGTGMRATYLVRSISGWFIAAAYQRDAWDDRLDAMMSTGDHAVVQLFGLLTKICVFITRIILIGIAWIAIGLTAFMLRQMEFDSDRYEAQFSGSKSFSTIFSKIHQLGSCMWKANEEVLRTYKRNRQVPENFPALIADFMRRLTPEERGEIERQMLKDKATFLATHPSTRSRIAAVEKLDAPGLYTDESPARDLFGDFESACKKASYGHYRAMFGPYLADATFVSSASLLKAGGDFEAKMDGIARYFGFEPPTWRPVFPPLASIPTVDDPRPLVNKLKAAKAELKTKAAAARAKVSSYRDATETTVKWEQAKSVMDAGFAFNFKQAGLASTTRAGVSHQIEKLGMDASDAASAIDDASDMAGLRLGAALCLLGSRGIDKIVKDAETKRHRANELLRAMTTLRETLAIAKSVRVASASALAVSQAVTKDAMIDKAKQSIRPLSDQVRNSLDDARRAAGGTPDPFSPPDSCVNLGETLVGVSPAWRDFEEIFIGGDTFVDRYGDMVRRTTAELVQIAESVEQAIASAVREKAAAAT